VRSRSERRLALFDDMPITGGPFRRYVEGEVFGGAAGSMSQAIALYKMANPEHGVAASDEIYAFWSDLPLLSDDVAIVSARYRQALAGKLGHVAELDGMDPTIDRDGWALAALDAYARKLNDHPRTAEILSASLIDMMTQYFSSDATAKALAKFEVRFPDSRYGPFLQQSYTRAMGMDGEAIAERIRFLDRSGESRNLSELRGRVVYVDFWGSWCRACLMQTPHLKSLAANIDDRDVVILGINMGDSEQAWRATTVEKGLPGLQWRPASPDDEALLTELAQLRAYPRFMILDRDGEIVSSSAPQPSAARAMLQRVANVR